MTTTIKPVRRTTTKTAARRTTTRKRPVAKSTSARTSAPRKPAAKKRSPQQRSTAARSTSQSRKPRVQRPTRPVTTTEGRTTARMMSLLVLGLSLFGLVMVLSATSVAGVYVEQSLLYHFSRQLMWAGVGAVVFLAMSHLDYRRLQPVATVSVVASVVLLVAVLIPGVGSTINGSSRWLTIGPMTIQPAEFAKLSLIVFCADLLTRRAKKMDRPDLTIRPILVVLGLFTVLLLLQPKLGTAIVLTAVALTMLFIAGARLDHLFGITLAGIVLAAFFAYSADYRRARIFAFLNPWEDPTGVGLQTIQSQVGIASGGLFGVGLGGARSKWGFLPHAHSDFIFAIVAEEIGLIGGIGLILAFVLFGYLGIRVAINAPDRFGMLLAAGLTSWILFQAFLNIGMAIGQLPITGEPLPFVSAGGSSLVTSLAAAGLLTSIGRRAKV